MFTKHRYTVWPCDIMLDHKQPGQGRKSNFWLRLFYPALITCDRAWHYMIKQCTFWKNEKEWERLSNLQAAAPSQPDCPGVSRLDHSVNDQSRMSSRTSRVVWATNTWAVGLAWRCRRRFDARSRSFSFLKKWTKKLLLFLRLSVSVFYEYRSCFDSFFFFFFFWPGKYLMANSELKSARCSFTNFQCS